MVPILQATFSNAFSWTKILVFWFEFHWSLFPMAQLTSLGSNNGLVPKGWQAIIWTNDDLVHYNDVIMTKMASQITRLAVVYSTVYSDADRRKHQSSASLAFVWGIHRDRWIPRTKAQLRGKCLHLMTSSCYWCIDASLGLNELTYARRLYWFRPGIVLIT